MPPNPSETIAVVGLGYVGLPAAVAFAKKYKVIGFDVDPERIAELKAGNDRTREVEPEELEATRAVFTAEPADLAEATFIVVAVPTPIDAGNKPDLTYLQAASKLVGPQLRAGDVVVFESTVCPGVTEDVCGPLLQACSNGLVCGSDFTLGYSPERINPGDKVHTFEKVVKVVSGQDQPTLERVARVYESVIEAGVHRCPSIMVAEACKVIENTQRDLNIALMNELALIFDRMGIRTHDVLTAAGTKWNFLKFTPGLVGGHCIGVDPYYLVSRAQELGYEPDVIMAGRRVNTDVAEYIARRTLKMLAAGGASLSTARIGILGLTFKENVPDLRNSRVPDIMSELEDFGLTPMVHDPYADAANADHEYGVELAPWDKMRKLDALIYAVAHDFYEDQRDSLLELVRDGGIVIDVKSRFDPSVVVGTRGLRYWSL